MIKEIKGQAWILGDKLVQTVTEFNDDNVSESNKVLVEDIWADLQSDSGTYKVNEKGNFFYWEYEMTDSEVDDLMVKVFFECPKPKEGIDFSTGKGKWVDYWKKRYEAYVENYKKRSTIQPETIDLGSYNYFNPETGNIDKIPAKSYKREGLSDIQNLLFMF